MSWWKHFVRGTENVFRGMAGKGPIGAQNMAGTASPGPDAAASQPMGGAASSNAGDAVVNYQTKGKPGLQQPGQPAAQSGSINATGGS